jgi:uncharacterized protein with PQ loop repeat
MKKSTLILSFIIFFIFGLGFIVGLEFDHVILGIESSVQKDTNTPIKLFSACTGIIMMIVLLYTLFKKEKLKEQGHNK